MRAFTALRWTGALWLLPLLFGLGVYIGLTNRSYEVGYTAAELAAASRAVVLLGPLLAAAAALRFPDLERAVRVIRPTRTLLRALIATFWPLLVGGPLVGVAALVSTVRALPKDTSSVMVCLVAAAALMASVCVGFLAARVLPRVAAIPAAALASFAWLALPGSGSDVILRNMNSSFVGCCTAETTPASTLFAASLTTTLLLSAVTVAMAASLVWWTSPRPVAAAASVVALVVAGCGGYLAAATVGPEANLLAVQSRTTPMSCVDSPGGAEVCVWPEHGDHLSVALTVVDDANAQLVAIGADPAQQVSERPQEGWVQISADVPTREDTQFTFAQGLISDAVRTCRYVDRAPAYDDVLAYLSLLVGVSPERWANSGYSPEALATAQDELARPAPDQLTFLRKQTAAIAETCGGA